MNVDIKQLNSCYQSILQGVILSEAEYLPALHQSAERLRQSVKDIDNARRQGLARLFSSVQGAISTADPLSMQELLSALNATEDEAEKQLLQNALDELKQNFKQQQGALVTQFVAELKKIHNGRCEMSESIVGKKVKTALIACRKEQAALVIWCRDNLTPLMKELADEIASIDSSIKKLTDKNLFEKAATLLPSFNGSEEDPEDTASKAAQLSALPFPETEVIKYGIEVAKEALGLMGEIVRVTQLIDTRIELKKKKDRLQKMLDEAFARYHVIEKNIFEMKQLSEFVRDAKSYFQMTLPLEDELQNQYELLHGIAEDGMLSGSYKKVLTGLQIYLETLDLIWR